MCKQIALVEDNAAIRKNHSQILIHEGYEVVSFSNQYDALDYFKNTLPDIVILEVGLNDERDAGYQLCSTLRQFSQTLPIIFLTSRDKEFDRISGLRVGADDYITKDIGINYLIAKIEALFSRIQALTQANTCEHKLFETKQTFGSLEFDASHMLAYWKGKLLSLTLTQYWILNELASNAGEIKDYYILMQVANICVEPNTISAHIKTIRNSFRSEDEHFNCIKTERSAGYRWVEV